MVSGGNYSIDTLAVLLYYKSQLVNDTTTTSTPVMTIETKGNEKKEKTSKRSSVGSDGRWQSEIYDSNYLCDIISWSQEFV